MQIHRRDVYSVCGRDFDSAEKARAHIVDCVGEKMQRAIRDAGCVLHPRDEIRVVESIMANAPALIELLSAYVSPVDNDWFSE